MEDSLLKEIDRREKLDKSKKEIKAFKEQKREEQVSRTAGRKMVEREAKERKEKRTRVIKKIKRFSDVAGFKQAMMGKGRKVRVAKARVKVARAGRLKELKRKRVEISMLGRESPFFEQREQKLSRVTEQIDLLSGKRKKQKQELTFLGKGNI